MPQRDATDLEFADFYVGTVAKLDKPNISRHGVETDRKVVRVVLVLEAFFDFGVAAVNDDLVAGCICWREEGKSHDVIPVGVAY